MTRGEKATRLERILSRKNYYNKFNEKIFEESILNHIKINPASTSGISNQLGAGNQKVFRKLNLLEKKGVIEKVGKTSPNRAFIWKIKEVSKSENEKGLGFR